MRWAWKGQQLHSTGNGCQKDSDNLFCLSPWWGASDSQQPFCRVSAGDVEVRHSERTGRGVDALPPDDTDEPLAILFTF